MRRVSIATFSHYPAIPPPLEVPLFTEPGHACAYLPGRTARFRSLLVRRLPASIYQGFMDAGFRRSGKVIYQPACPGCRACQPLRVVVERFAPSKSQRRCWRDNQDLRVEVAAPAPSDEAFELYKRYLDGWHERDSAEQTRESFEQFLYDSPVNSLEFRYRDEAGALLAVGICDVLREALSSVYFFFDPRQRGRGLGNFGAMYEIEYARTRAMPHYYLGYWINGCAKMQYKNRFEPYELLGTDGQWRAPEQASGDEPD
jgi:arginine-tRNA-protein transferase